FQLVPAGPVSLSDEPSPWTPFAVVEERAELDRLEQMAGRDDLTEFTGREAEVASLARAVTDATNGRGQLVTISGEAGLGKSRLLLECRRQMGTAATRIL